MQGIQAWAWAAGAGDKDWSGNQEKDHFSARLSKEEM